jgi:hypothetical protein
MIRAYPRHPSVLPGDTLTLHVASAPPHVRGARFRVNFYRWGDGPQRMLQGNWLPAATVADGAPDQDWDWPAYRFPIPPHWPSGVYIADIEEAGRKAVFDLARGHGAALFVVRPRRGPASGALLYKLPLATYHAYNCSGGACFYRNPPRSPDPPGARVSLRRPGGGIGGPVWCAPDHYDASSPRQTFAHWDARFIRWLVRNGYAADYCTDLDLHADPALAAGYRLLVAAGHDEYWSSATRDAVQRFVEAGGNVAFFGANLCWWRIHLVDGASAMVCHQGGPGGARDHWWPRHGAARPEDSLCGVSYRHGGGWWDGARTGTGYVIRQPDHWLFAGTGLRRGDVLGRDSWPPLVGYECDGAPLAACATGAGGDGGDGAVLAADAVDTGTPADYAILAAARLGPGWQELPAREHHGAGEGIHAATLGLFTNGGTVFSAGTTDWAQVLGCGRDRQVERITRNVLDGLLGRHAAEPALA